VGYEEQINQVHALSRYLLGRLKQAADFELVLDEVLTLLFTLLLLITSL